MGQVGLDRHIGLSVLVGQVRFHRTVPLVLHGTDGIGRTGFHRTVPLVLHGTGGIGRTHRIECVGGTDRIPHDCPTCPTWDRWYRMDT